MGWWFKFSWWIILPLAVTLLNIYTGLRDGVKPLYLFGALAMAFSLGIGWESYRPQLSAWVDRKHAEALRQAAEDAGTQDW